MSIDSLADLLHPVPEADFLARIHDREALHIPAVAPDRFAGLMNWRILTDLLNMTAIWTDENLSLVLDGAVLPPQSYCIEAIDRRNHTVAQPDATRVLEWLGRGASLVVNDIDTLHPGLARAAGLLEERLGGKAQGNLYCSRVERQAFASHFDTHEVFALHIAGEKRWRLYEGRVDRPIAHPDFKNLPPDYHARHRGKVAREVTMRPGDVLYIPRGLYHDAMATADGAIHVAFGVTHVIGYDLFRLLQARVVADPLFRQNLPLPGAPAAATRRHVRQLADRLAKDMTSESFAADLRRLRAAHHYPRGGFDLPAGLPGTGTPGTGLPGTAAPGTAAGYRVARGLSIVRQNGKPVLATPRGRLTIPKKFTAAVDWVIGQDSFTTRQLATALPDLPDSDQATLLRQLKTAGAIHPNPGPVSGLT